MMGSATIALSLFACIRQKQPTFSVLRIGQLHRDGQAAIQDHVVLEAAALILLCLVFSAHRLSVPFVASRRNESSL